MPLQLFDSLNPSEGVDTIQVDTWVKGRLPVTKDTPGAECIRVWMRPLSAGEVERILDKSVSAPTGGRGRTEVKAGHFTMSQLARSIVKWEGIVDAAGQPAKPGLDAVRLLPQWLLKKLEDRLADLSELDEDDVKN